MHPFSFRKRSLRTLLRRFAYSDCKLKLSVSTVDSGQFSELTFRSRSLPALGNSAPRATTSRQRRQRMRSRPSPIQSRREVQTMTPRLIDVYGFFGTICGYWGAQQGTLPPWANVPELNITYDKIDKLIFTNYGDRPISRYLMEYLKLGDGKLTPQNEQIISYYVLDMCRLSWARLTADFAAEYNPIENYNMSENEGIDDRAGGKDTTTRTYDDYKETEKLGHTIEADDTSNIFGFDNRAIKMPELEFKPKPA